MCTCLFDSLTGCKDDEKGKILHQLFHTPFFNINVVKDTAGVEICGALKVKKGGGRGREGKGGEGRGKGGEGRGKGKGGGREGKGGEGRGREGREGEGEGRGEGKGGEGRGKGGGRRPEGLAVLYELKRWAVEEMRKGERRKKLHHLLLFFTEYRCCSSWFL